MNQQRKIVIARGNRTGKDVYAIFVEGIWKKEFVSLEDADVYVRSLKKQLSKRKEGNNNGMA